MAYLFLMCVLCEVFLVRFLLALVRENRVRENRDVSRERGVVPRRRERMEWTTRGLDYAIRDDE
jgi:hypothetical protein